MVTRGEVWHVALDPTRGSAIQKTRPCVVISPDEMHDHLRTVIVAPMTTKHRPAPYRVPVAFDQREGLILLDQLRTVDKARLLKRSGDIPEETLTDALDRLREMFAD